MNGIIQLIRFFPEKGSPGLELNEGRLVENLGLEGDFHAIGGERQIALSFTKPDENEHGLCLSRFK